MKSDLLIPNSKRTLIQLGRLQKLPLEQKINLSLRRIKQFSNELDGKIYVAFSGGKDSTVLLHLVRSLFPETEAVFCDTGLEYPEIKTFVKDVPNVKWIHPKITFNKVLDKYGYPVISKETSQKLDEIRRTNSDKLRNKRLYGDENGYGKVAEKWKFMLDAPFKISNKCCNVMKKEPSKRYEKESGNYPIVGTMAEESSLRKTTWLKNGCNSFKAGRNMSTPLAFWTEDDIWNYIKLNNLSYSKIYDMGETRTGCMFCLYGCQYKENVDKFERMKEKHPKQYNLCTKLGVIDALDYVNRGEHNADTE